MAKRKNAVKSGLNQLRQALLDVKTAIIHFSDDHIVSIGYDPSSKATVVTDIPQNLSSQFTLGEGGGGGNSATPVLDVTITNNDEHECSFSGDFICIENNKYSSHTGWGNPINPNQSEEFLVPVVSYDSGSSYLFYLPSPYDSSVTIRLLDAVNCTYDENNTALSITDPSENASCTVIYE